MDANEYLANFPAQVPVGLNLSTLSGDLLKRKGLASAGEPPVLEIKCRPNTLPDPEDIDQEADCLVFVETGEIVTLVCSISDLPEKNILRLKVRELFQHGDKREFYRGPAQRLHIQWSLQKAEPDEEWLLARGVNISCGGLLIEIDRPLKKQERLLFQIALPEPVRKTVTAKAKVLRVQAKDVHCFAVAVQFTDQDGERCDDIMAFCFAEQRRMLREQVITKDI
jgi:hypothetical protein